MGGEAPFVVSCCVRVVFLFRTAGDGRSLDIVFVMSVGSYYLWSQWLVIMLVIAPLAVASKTMT